MGALGVGLGLCGCVSQVGEADRLVLERRKLRLRNWEADGFKVGFLADLHVDSAARADRARRAIEMLLDEKPDVVLIGGDFQNERQPWHEEMLDTALSPLSRCTAPVLAVLGNHDFWAGRPEAIQRALTGLGASLMKNDSVIVDGVEILGYDDAFSGRPDFGLASKVRQRRSRIALIHEPDAADRLDGTIGIVLAGHSHGGQVCLPLGISLQTPVGARKYVSGFYRSARNPLYVTRGVGTTGPDVRAFCPPEVTVLELHGGAKA